MQQIKQNNKHNSKTIFYLLFKGSKKKFLIREKEKKNFIRWGEKEK